jgi:hypothetical protein
MDYPRSDLAATSVFIEPAPELVELLELLELLALPELLELELAEGALLAPDDCVVPLSLGGVVAVVAGLSAEVVAAGGVVYCCATATPITLAVAIVAAALAKNFVLLMLFSFGDLTGSPHRCRAATGRGQQVSCQARFSHWNYQGLPARRGGDCRAATNFRDSFAPRSKLRACIDCSYCWLAFPAPPAPIGPCSASSSARSGSRIAFRDQCPSPAPEGDQVCLPGVASVASSTPATMVAMPAA